MKILQIVSGKQVNGAVVHVNLLSRKLVERGHEVIVLGRPGSWILKTLAENNIACHESDMDRLPPTELFRVANWVRQEQFDVIHTHMSRAHFFGVLLRRLTGVPCVATAHASHFQLHWRMNDLVIANSTATYNYQARINRVPRHRMVTIPCFIDWEKFHTSSPDTRPNVRQQLGIGTDQPLIGVVGEVVKRKGHLELVQALPALLKTHPDLRVVFVGKYHRSDRYYQRIRKQLVQKKLFRRVIWLGQRDNVHELIQAFDVCVVPSLVEPLGLCAIEAMTAGVPVAAARVGGLKEFVETGFTGMLFNPRSPEELAAATSRLLEDDTLRQRIQKTARAMVEDRFHPDPITDRIVEALGSVARPLKQKKSRLVPPATNLHGTS